MGYTKEQIIAMCEEASADMKSFYKAKVVNYKGQTKEMFYSEIVAEWLLKNLKKFDDIPQIKRNKDYKTESHNGETIKKTNRIEEFIAKQLYNSKKTYKGFGKIIDYQTPLKNSKEDKGLGKIDLLSQNDEEKNVYILELKKEDSEESMLRCVLESYTYLRIVSKEKLLDDFEVPEGYKLFASPLVFMEGQQFKEYKESLEGKRPFLKELMEKLNSKPFFIQLEKGVFKSV